MSFNSNSSGTRRVCVIGGGLAGIACASALAKHGFQVALYEARNQLGGRASSYHDQSSQEVIDNCQHVSMGCCTNLKKLITDLGIAGNFKTQNELFFISPDHKITPFRECWLPAPFHLSLSFWRLPYLSLREKYRFASAVRELSQTSPSELRGRKFIDWLADHRQSQSLINRVWEVVLVSSLSESLDRIDAAYAKKVFFDGFLANREGWRVEIPSQSLDELYSTQTNKVLQEVGVQVLFNTRIKKLNSVEKQVHELTDTNENLIHADEYVFAVPHKQLLNLLSDELRTRSDFEMIEQIESAPISSVHLWLDRKITDLQHAVFVEKFSQWLFSRGVSENPEETEKLYRYQIVISASRSLASMTAQEIVDTVMDELAEVWSTAKSAKCMHFRVITEKRAVFSATPGIDEIRPLQRTSVENLFLAGDWTQTNWPATMEGAVRSGYLAAEEILKKYGIDEKLVVPDLKQTWLSRLLFGARIDN